MIMVALWFLSAGTIRACLFAIFRCFALNASGGRPVYKRPKMATLYWDKSMRDRQIGEASEVPDLWQVSRI